MRFFPQLSLFSHFICSYLQILCKSRAHLRGWNDPSRIFQICVCNWWYTGISGLWYHRYQGDQRHSQGLNTACLFFPLLGKSSFFPIWYFLPILSFLVTPINDSLSSFFHMPSCLPFPEASSFSVCWPLPWTMATDPLWVKGKKFRAGKSRSSFLTKMKNALDFAPARCLRWVFLFGTVHFTLFPLWVLSPEQYLPFLFYIFI